MRRLTATMIKNAKKLVNEVACYASYEKLVKSCLINGAPVRVFVVAVVSPSGLCNDVFNERVAAA